MIARRIRQALIITALASISTTIAEAQPLSGEAPLKLSQGTVVGSWLDTVAVAGGPTFKSLSTLTEDGGWISHDQGSVITDPPFPHVFSAGHGVWVRQGKRTFSQTALQLISDLKGGLLFVNKIRQTLTLDKSGNAYSARWTAEFTDPAGNPIASFEGTTEGQRIKVDSPR